jgi:hypothetical protein
MSGTWVCIECGNRQADAGTCRCGGGELLDARREQVRELMADIDRRASDRREATIRWAAVVLGAGIIVALWLVPGYWYQRGRLYPGLPFLADQFAFMIGLAILFLTLGKRVFGHRPRFPYLDEQQQLATT